MKRQERQRNQHRYSWGFYEDPLLLFTEERHLQSKKKEELYENSSDLCSIFERQTDRAIH